jgi:hypothetical protein
VLLEMLASLVLGLVDVLTSAVPDPGVVVEAGGMFVLGYQQLNAALPLDTMIVCFGLTLSLMGALFPFLLQVYIYRLLPFKGS